MSKKTIKEQLQSFGLNKAISMVDSDPDKNIPRLVELVKKLDRDHVNKGEFEAIDAVIQDPNNNWYRFIKSLWSDIDDGSRRVLFENFVINAATIGSTRQKKFRKEYNCNIPWAILLDPTSACNLHCTGCWAAEYGDKLNMDYDTLNSIIEQGKELGVFMFIYSGGEPLVRKKDIIRLCEEHKDCMFLAFTNGTLIDEAFADEMLRVKNFIPAISIEGFEEETDARRGKGPIKE